MTKAKIINKLSLAQELSLTSCYLCDIQLAINTAVRWDNKEILKGALVDVDRLKKTLKEIIKSK